MPTAPPPRTGAGHPAAVVLGALACVATEDLSTYVTTAFLANRTLDQLEVRVYRARTPLACGPDATANAMASAFDPGYCAVFQPGDAKPLDRGWWPDGHGPANPPPPEPGCEAVIIRVAGLPDTLLVWERQKFLMIPRHEGDLDPHGIYLERAGSQLFAAGTPLITATPVNLPLPETKCADFPAIDGDGGRPSDVGGGQ